MSASVESSVSVCVPTHEPEPRHLDALLRSIVGQGVPNLEVVVIDDASSTDVASVVVPWMTRLDVTLDRNLSNLGMVGNWNEAVHRSCGALVMVVGQDDVLAPDTVRRFATELARRPDAALCAGGEVLIDGEGRPLGRRPGITHRSRIYRARERYELGREDLVALCLRNGQAYGEPSSVMFRRRVFDRVGGYRRRYVHTVDIDFNLRAAELGAALYVNRPVVLHRIHPGRLTERHIASGEAARDRVRLHVDYGPTIDPALTARARVTLVSSSLRDVLRAIRARRWGVARFGLVTAWRYRANPPAAYAAHLVEIVTKRNLDQR